MNNINALKSLSKNEKDILHWIYFYKNISRTELLNLTGIKIATLYRTIDSLIERNLVRAEKNDETSTIGRPSDILSLNNEYIYICSISVQRFRTIVALIDFSGEIIDSVSFSYDKEITPDFLLKSCFDKYKILLSRNNIPENIVLGVSITSFGHPNFLDGKTKKKYPGFNWNNYDIQNAIQHVFLKETWFEFNARAAAWGNYADRFPESDANLAYVIINEGIGIGAVVDNNLISGGQRSVNSLGHMVINVNGKECVCGRYGCLETESSTTAIVENTKALLKLGHRSSLSEHPDSLTFAEIARAAEDGDSLAVSTIETAACHFVIALINYLTILDVKLIIIGGDLPSASPLFCNFVSEKLYKALNDVSFQVEENEDQKLLKGVASSYFVNYLK